MYTQHWGLTKSPFTGPARGSLFYATSGQSEAIARLDYVTKNGRRCAVLAGDDGLGKSSVFEHLAEREARRGNVAISMSLLGMDESEFVVTLAEKLGEPTKSSTSSAILWRAIFDRLTVNQFRQKSTILMLDDAQDASTEVITALGRLSQWNPAHETKVTILLSTTPESMPRLGKRLLDLCDLKIQLRPWKLEDTIGYVRSSIEHMGGAPTVFDNQALETLHTLSEGSPRNLRRLAELALVAGAAQRAKQIGAATVRAVDAELRMPYPTAAA